MKRRILLVSALVLCVALLLTGCSDNSTPAPASPTKAAATAAPQTAEPASPTAAAERTISALKVTTLPAVTELFVGDTFSPEGGELTVTYSDGSTQTLPLTSSELSLSAVNTKKAGTKTVTVEYGGKKTTFKVSVQAQGYAVTLDHNYEGAPEAKAVNAVKNDLMDRPDDPVRDGFSFYNWFVDAACTRPFDFSAPITADLHLYAAWKENGADYHEVTYDLGYAGVKERTFTQIVKSGDTLKPLDLTPARDEYAFEGWLVNGSPLDTAAPITADTLITGSWTKTKTGVSTYVFEAEQTDLSGKIGPGFSGTAQEESMIVIDDRFAPSAGRFVSYLYQNGNSLEFWIASGEAVTDAVLTVTVAAEMENINFGPDEVQVLVNGQALSYSGVRLAENAPFADAIEISGVALEEGVNLIQIAVTNTIRPLGESGTYAATAPMVDCVKVTTSAVLTWDAGHGLPRSY